jgi:hypothetical protein
MIERKVEIGPGSIRVGRFIGRPGVVPMPAVGRGLGLVDRVIRRHVAKLEKVGWCERVSAVRGDGMLVWMTPTGLDRVGLGQLPAPRAPNPFSPQTLRSTRVAWAAADIEHAGHQWIASRELALAPDGWSVEIANERGGYSRRLPDLVFWSACDRRRQAAVVIAPWLSNPRRERAAVEGWQRSIVAGRYAQVCYVVGPAFVSHLSCVAEDIGVTAPQLIVGEPVMVDELPSLSSVVENADEESVAQRFPSRQLDAEADARGARPWEARSPALLAPQIDLVRGPGPSD